MIENKEYHATFDSVLLDCHLYDPRYINKQYRIESDADHYLWSVEYIPENGVKAVNSANHPFLILYTPKVYNPVCHKNKKESKMEITLTVILLTVVALSWFIGAWVTGSFKNDK